MARIEWTDHGGAYLYRYLSDRTEMKCKTCGVMTVKRHNARPNRFIYHNDGCTARAAERDAERARREESDRQVAEARALEKLIADVRAASPKVHALFRRILDAGGDEAAEDVIGALDSAATCLECATDPNADERTDAVRLRALAGEE